MLEEEGMVLTIENSLAIFDDLWYDFSYLWQVLSAEHICLIGG